MERDATRKRELTRGAQVAARAARRELLARYNKLQNVKTMVALPGHAGWAPTGQVNMYYVDGELVATENTERDNFPSDDLMATLALAIGATVGLGAVPSDDKIDASSAHGQGVTSGIKWRAYFARQKAQGII